MSGKKRNKGKNQTNTNKSWFELFCEWMTWTKAGVIIAGLGLLGGALKFLVPYYIDWRNSPNEYEVLITEINDHIHTINETFKPNVISLENDSLSEFQHIKNFQTKALELASIIQALYKSKSLDNYLNNTKQFSYVLQGYYLQSKQTNNLFQEIMQESIILSGIATDHHLLEYLSHDPTLQIDVLNALDIKNKKYDETLVKMQKFIDSGRVNKSINSFVELTNDKDCLYADAKLLEYIIDLNRIYEVRIRKQSSIK